jgi:two-component system cell cycle sensor histidine kinase/response regulator CckA
MVQRSERNDDIGRTASAHQDRCQTIVENAPEILALLGDAGIILYVCPHTQKLLGYRQNELEGRSIFEFFHPEDSPRAAQEYSGAVQREGECVPSLIRVRDAVGTWVPFEIIANNRLQDPDIHAIVLTGHDLRFRSEIETAIRQANTDTEAEVAKRTTELAKINTELRIENQARRQAESQLQHMVSLLNATLDSTADGIVVVSNDGRVTSCNEKFVEMWHLSCAPIGRDSQSFVPNVLAQLKNPDESIDRARALYADRSATAFGVLHLKDGRIFERYSQPQRIHDKITGRVWSFRDVTQAKTLELELRQSQKMEALGRLAGGVAHDFNNLLMLISGYATQSIENPSFKEGREAFEQILATTRRAASLTKQLLAFSRKQPDAPAVADLNLIVLNLERMLRRLLSDQIQLEVSVAIGSLPVNVDVSQIEMMIMNLAVNAQDAMPEGGRLTIATTSKNLSSREDQAGETAAFATIEVSDTGYGITQEIQARIFEPFFTTKQLGRGTGLGLSTVLGIAERAGGRIEVQSEPNHGTTFRVYLPQVNAVPAAPIAGSRVSPPRGGQETILLAEDESGIRAMTRAYLETLGYRVLEAADGSQAIARSLEYGGPIHLVLTDLLMPGVRGDSAVKAIRHYRPTIKAVYMSGYAEQDLAEDPVGILYKPFEFPELGRRLRSVLDAGSANESGQFNPAAD